MKKNIVLVHILVVIIIGWVFVSQKNSVNNACKLAINDAVIKSQTQTAVSLVNGINAKIEKDEITKTKGEELASSLLRDIRYGDDGKGYFFADTTEGVNVVLYGNKNVEGKNRYNDIVNGVPYIKNIITQGIQGGGYTDYWYPKEGESSPLAKRAYSLLATPFNWVIGTGFYVEDVK